MTCGKIWLNKIGVSKSFVIWHRYVQILDFGNLVQFDQKMQKIQKLKHTIASRFHQKGPKKIKILQNFGFFMKKGPFMLDSQVWFLKFTKLKNIVCGSFMAKVTKISLKNGFEMLSPHCKYAKTLMLETFGNEFCSGQYCFGKVF